MLAGLIGLILSSIAIIAILYFERDAMKVSQVMEVDFAYYRSVISANSWGYVFLGTMVLSIAVLLSGLIVPCFLGLMDTLFASSNDSVVENNNSVPSSTDQQHTPTVPTKSAKKDWTVNQRINGLKPLIKGSFFSGSLWRDGNNHSRDFDTSLKALLSSSNENIMKLGHLAYLLFKNDLMRESEWTFADWIRTFFSSMGLACPGDTSINKYSEKNSDMSTAFDAIDKEFFYLDTEYIKKDTYNRPIHM